MTNAKVGDKVRLRTTVHIFPIGIYPAGLTGTIMEIDHFAMMQLDQYFPELKEWDNCLQVGLTESDEATCFLADLEVIS